MTTRTLRTVPALAPTVVGFPFQDETLARTQELGDRVAAGVRATALTALDAYDSSVRTATDLQVRLVEAGGDASMLHATRIQARLVVDLNEALTRAARACLA